MKRSYKGVYPICFLSNDSLLIFKRNVFYSLDLHTGYTKKVAKFQFSLKIGFALRIPLLSRALRLGIRCGIKISEEVVLFVIGKTIYELNFLKGYISKGYTTIDGSRPLVFSKIEGIKGFEDGIYFGGYKVNPTKLPISIFKRVSEDSWTTVYQFEEGAIEHVHNIVSDPYQNKVFIFTGDFDHSAGIWEAEVAFNKLTPLLTSEQKYRSCVGYPTKEGLLYATDGPFENNSIRILKRVNDNWRSDEVQSINGSSIYGCQWEEDFLFSTVVEGDGRDQSLRYKLFGRRKGAGIKEDACFIYKGNLKDGFTIIYKVDKDKLPFHLFQFGVLIFPSGLNLSSYLPVYHIATKKNDLSTLLLTKTL